MSRSRRERIREYREAPLVTGVGRIRNTVDDRSLLVTGRDLPGILNRHRAQLRMGAHSNPRLQSDWQRLGPGAFEFEVLDRLDPATAPGHDPGPDLRALEALWLEKLAPWEPAGYHRRAGPAAGKSDGR